MKMIESVKQGMDLVDTFKGEASDFTLVVPDTLNDALGMNMAIITDRVLARGWQPDGYTQREGCRVYRYKYL